MDGTKVVEWKGRGPLKKGTVFTIAGRYKRRSLREWLARRQPELQRYVLLDDAGTTSGDYAAYKEAE